VTPRASRTSVGGSRDGALAVRVTAPPLEGAANAAVARALAEALGVAPRDVKVELGLRGRRKLASAPASVRARLERLAAAGGAGGALPEGRARPPAKDGGFAA
jgi:hypothetical protein